MRKMRIYQEEAIESIFEYFKLGNKGNPNIALPTGTGKSVVLAGFIQIALGKFPRTRIMCLTHSKELVHQNSLRLAENWPDAPIGVYSAGLKRKDLGYPITFAGIDSVAKKAHLFGHIDLVLIDESHMVDWREKSRYHTFLDDLARVNPKLKVIGLTATPWRQGLGDIEGPEDNQLFTDRIYSRIGVEDFHWFVQEGWLAPVHPLRTTSKIDLTGVGILGGEFNQNELQAASNKEEITRAAIKESILLAGERKHWMVFCSGIQHVLDTTKFLNEMGISAVSVHSQQTQEENDENIRRCKSGEVQALVNMGVLTTGFDWAAVNYIMMLRATMSVVLWLQMVGRGTRPKGEDAPFQDCLIGDFAGNAKRLGPINDPVIPKRKGQKGGGTAPIKTCEHCECENHTMAKICQRCGNEFPPPKTKLVEYAGTDKLMRDSENAAPQVDIFKVDFTSYAIHRKAGKPEMLRVTYTCGFRMFNEYLCFEHEGYARVKARNWWKERFPDDPCPDTSQEVLDASDFFPQVSHLRVWHNIKYPEIKAYCFDYTAFGTIEAGSDQAGFGNAPELTAYGSGEPLGFSEDDIPF